ncbi:exonuclease SbcCD subunit D [Glaciihabitans tibetensis]|nr:exonuclease SbcCD subunit D [Glaciihabitans tibetensis]
MKILHTSDWHIGRTFHGHSTLEHLRVVLHALVAVVVERQVDVVVVAGDIFDSATPAAESYRVLTEALRGIRDAGATVIMTSGNHDSATRLGFQSEFAQLAGIHILTRPEQHSEPITISDAHGPVHFYGIPYLEPSLVRHLYPDHELRSHTQVLTFAMRRIRADAAGRGGRSVGGRSVVLSHCFAVDVAAPTDTSEASDVERDITAGGLDFVPMSTFDGPDYVALGHIHGRAKLSDRVRYSGAPLHYSFSEAHKPRGAWLVELGAPDATALSDPALSDPALPDPTLPDPALPDATLSDPALSTAALSSVEWIDLPVPRRLSVITGTLDDLVSDPSYAAYEGDWVSAILTDRVRPMDGMRRLQQRFPHCVLLEHRPVVTATATRTYAARVKSKSDNEIIGGFLEYVRNGVGPTEFERTLISDALSDQRARDSVA